MVRNKCIMPEFCGLLFRSLILISQLWQAPGQCPIQHSNHSNSTSTWRENKEEKEYQILIPKRLLVLALSLSLLPFFSPSFLLSPVFLSSSSFLLLFLFAFPFFFFFSSLFICRRRKIIIILV